MPHLRNGPIPFVGRIEESAALDDALSAAHLGHFVCVVVTGSSGVGKTALVRRFAERIGEIGVAVHWGNCREFGRSPPFWPWIQVMRAMGEDDTGAAVLERRPDDPFTMIDGLVESLSRQGSATRVVVLDDLHNADLGSLELLGQLCSGRDEMPLLVATTMDLDDLGEEPGRGAAIAKICGAARRLDLTGLDESDIELLVAGALGPADAAASDARRGLVAAFVDRAGGNALHVTGVLDLAVATGVDPELSMLQDLRDVVRHRLDGLPVDARDVLAVGALQGKVFDADVVGAVLDVPIEIVRSRLAEPLRHGLVDDEGMRYRFGHRLVAEVLRDDMDAGLRDQRQLRMARTIDVTASPLVPDVSRSTLVAMHLAEAGDVVEPGEVAAWLRRAVADARRVRAHGDAARLGDLAARYWRAAGSPEREAEALTEVVNDHLATGLAEEAVATAHELAGLARRLGSAQLLAGAALARAQVFDPGQTMDGADLLREALVHPDNRAPSDLRAELLGQLASVMGMPSITGQPDDATGARRVITELREMIRHHPTERARAALALAELNVMSGPTHFAERQAWFANGVGANPSGRLQDRLERAYWETSLAFERGEIDAVGTAIESWAVLADRSPSMYWRWRVTMAKASLLYVQGRFDEAVLVARQSLSLVVNLYPAMAYRVYAGLLFAVRREQGRLDDLAGDLVAIADEHPGFAGGLDGHGLSALAPLIALEGGDVERARNELPPVVRATRAAPTDELFWLCLASLVATCADGVGDEDAARWAAAELEPFRDQFVMWGRAYVPGGPVVLALALAYRGAGDLDSAAACFRDTVEWADRAGAPAFAVRGRLGLAQLAAEERDRDELLVQVQHAAQVLGMSSVAATATELLGPRAGARPVESRVTAQATVRVLGRFEVRAPGADAPSRWTSRKARDALKILISHRGRSIPREQMIDLLWPEASVSTGRSRLSVVLSMVRGALDPARLLEYDPLVGDRQAIALDLDVVTVDAEELLRGVATARERRRAGDLAGAHDMLRSVVERAGSHEAFSDDPYADWSHSFRLEVERTYRDAVTMLAAGAATAGDDDESAHWRARLVELDPDNEESNEALLAALGLAGRVADAEAHRRAMATRDLARDGDRTH